MGRRWRREEITVTHPDELRRVVAGTAIGNFTEWYDFGVFGFLATTIANVFFPSGSGSAAGLLATFATLAAAFIVRPLGGLVFGPLGDRIGRKRVLALTITMMAAGTTVTGVLPSYHSVGVWAVILLLVTRMVQGFSTGGEYAGAMIFIGEHSPDRSRGKLSGWLPFGTLSGYILGAGLVTALTAALSQDAMTSWGWRIPFLLGAPLGLIGLYMRLRLEETPSYSHLAENERAASEGGWQQFRDTIVEQWRPLLICAGLVLTFNVTNYMLTGYVPTYLQTIAGVGKTESLLMVVIVLAVLLAVVTGVAWLSDRIGRKPIMWTGCGLLLIASVPAFVLMRDGSGFAVMFFGVLLVGLMLLCFNSTEPSTLPTLFPTRIRYGALAIGFNVSVSAFGGTTPLVTEALVAATGNDLMPAYYLMMAGAVGVATVAFLREPAGRPLPGSAPAVASEQEADELAGQSAGAGG